jgi:hypothetical protein
MELALAPYTREKEEMTKVCNKCGIEKGISEFYKHVRCKYGVRKTCKVCVKKYNRSDTRRRNNIIYKRSDKGKASIQKALQGSQKIYERNRYKTEEGRLRNQAYAAVYYSIKRGDIPPVTECICSVCNKEPASEYHHISGYSKEHRLDVVPVCLSCHKIEHRKTL